MLFVQGRIVKERFVECFDTLGRILKRHTSCLEMKEPLKKILPSRRRKLCTVSRAVRCNLQNITSELLTFLSLHFTLRYVELVYDYINERVQRKIGQPLKLTVCIILQVLL